METNPTDNLEIEQFHLGCYRNSACAEDFKLEIRFKNRARFY